MPVRSAALVLLLAAAAQPQTPQQQAVARQRQSIDQQLAALSAASNTGALAGQALSISKQKTSTLSQPRLAWTELPSPDAVAAAPAWPCTPLPAAVLGPIVERAARVNSLAPRLLHAVIGRESSSLPCAVSRAGAQGLMQLMPSTAIDLGVEDPFDPEQNVAAGSRFLRQLLDRFGGDLGLALGAYNAGPARVEEFGAIPPIPETKAYVDDILSRLR